MYIPSGLQAVFNNQPFFGVLKACVPAGCVPHEHLPRRACRKCDGGVSLSRRFRLIMHAIRLAELLNLVSMHRSLLYCLGQAAPAMWPHSPFAVHPPDTESSGGHCVRLDALYGSIPYVAASARAAEIRLGFSGADLACMAADIALPAH